MALVTDYRIVVSQQATANERRAAALLSVYIRLITGRKPEIVEDDTAPRKWEIVIGKTRRETAFGVPFARSRDRRWEYEVRSADGRLYLTGLGCPPETEPPYNTAYRLMDDGGIGTVFAACHFVEDILGCNFLYLPFDGYVENADAEIPENYEFLYTKERLSAELPQRLEGAAMHLLPSCAELDWNMNCLIFQSRSGKLIVVDGGFTGDADHVVRALEALAPDGKPVVEAWLFSHLHRDHYGVYQALCEQPALRERVQVKHFYSCLLPESFYLSLSPEANEIFRAPLNALTTSDRTLGARLHTVRKGDVIGVDELHFEVLHVPDMAFAREMNVNDSSVVYRLTCEGQSLLLLGDAESVCSNDLLQNAREKLKCDIVQIGHHGCGNVSRECYRAIGANACLWLIGNRFWYGDNGEGLNTHNTGVIRTRTWIRELGIRPENDYRVTNGILSLSLPMRIH